MIPGNCWSCNFLWSHGESTQHNYIFSMLLHFFFNRWPSVPDIYKSYSIWAIQYSQVLALCKQNRWPVLQPWMYILLTCEMETTTQEKWGIGLFISFIGWLTSCWNTVKLFLVAMCAAAHTENGDEIVERCENFHDAADNRRMKVTVLDRLWWNYVLLI